jgi:hypothetical protein
VVEQGACPRNTGQRRIRPAACHATVRMCVRDAFCADHWSSAWVQAAC